MEDDIKVNEIFKILSDYYKVEVDTLSFGAKLLISPMTNLKIRNKRQDMYLSELLSSFGVVLDNSIYEIQMSCLLEDDDYELPNLKFHYKMLN